MTVRYLSHAERERARLRERVTLALARNHLAVHYPSLRWESVRVDVLRGDAGSTVLDGVVRFPRGPSGKAQLVRVTSVVDEQGRPVRTVVR